MDVDSIECVSSVDGMEEEEIPHHDSNRHNNHQVPAKPRNNAIPTAIAPATSVHELLECPVCTNSMYPPIHQVSLSLSLSLSLCVCVFVRFPVYLSFS